MTVEPASDIKLHRLANGGYQIGDFPLYVTRSADGWHVLPKAKAGASRWAMRHEIVLQSFERRKDAVAAVLTLLGDDPIPVAQPFGEKRDGALLSADGHWEIRRYEHWEAGPGWGLYPHSARAQEICKPGKPVTWAATQRQAADVAPALTSVQRLESR